MRTRPSSTSPRCSWRSAHPRIPEQIPTQVIDGYWMGLAKRSIQLVVEKRRGYGEFEMDTQVGKDGGGRRRLPQLIGDRLFVTDGGLETDLIFHGGIDMPHFAAFPLLENAEHRARLRRYYDGYLAIARNLDAGLVIETPTWRANPDWAEQLGYSLEAARCREPRRRSTSPRRCGTAAAADGVPAVVSGCIGPRGDGYDPGERDDARGGRALPRGPDRLVRRHHGRPGHRDHDDQRRRGDRHRAGRRGGGHPVPRSRSRWRPTGCCRRASRCARPSNRWTRRPTAAPPTSWSTARTRPISTARSNRTGRGCNDCVGLRANASDEEPRRTRRSDRAR